MRSDYALYGVAVVFFIVAGVCLAFLSGDQRSLTVVSTIVLGLLSIGLGYSQRPKTATTTQPATETTTPTTQPTKAQEKTKTEISSVQIPRGEAEIIVAPVTAIQEKPEPAIQPLMEIPPPAEQAPSAPTVLSETPTLAQPPAPTIELTRIKGIKEKRAAQLRSLGISNANDLAKASADDIADKLKISTKIVEKWVKEAKQLSGT